MKLVYTKQTTDQLTNLIVDCADHELTELSNKFGEYVQDNLGDMFHDFVWNSPHDDSEGICLLQHLVAGWGVSIQPTGWMLCRSFLEEEQDQKSED